MTEDYVDAAPEGLIGTSPRMRVIHYGSGERSSLRVYDNVRRRNATAWSIALGTASSAFMP